jgi:hypothetical protein
MIPEKLTYDTFVPTLLAELPGFKEIYDAHLRDYDTILPHVLVGDLTRYVIRAYRQMSTDASGQARRVVDRALALLEQAMQSTDAQLQELVSVSFLENLPQADEDYDAIKALLGPHLEKELAHYESL